MRKLNALISVFNKNGIDKFAAELVKHGCNVYASGGTAKALIEAGIPVTDVADLVGEAILGHRVVTLSREVHAGLLATESAKDLEELERIGAPFFDIVCLDFYPLRKEIQNPDATPQSVIEKTDIGGPAMLRAAAKGRRIVICDPADRQHVLDALAAGLLDSDEFRTRLAAKAEFMAADYALTSARYTGSGAYEGIVGTRYRRLKYGENPHQAYAAVYETEDGGGPFAPSSFKQIEGTDPSLVNMTDLDRSLATMRRVAAGWKQEFGSVPKIAVSVKHGNVCGLGVDIDSHQALGKMIAGNPEALFGGVVLSNFGIDVRSANYLQTHLTGSGKRVLDVVIAPGFSKQAVDILARKNGKCRLILNQALTTDDLATLDSTSRVRQIAGGFLSQDADMVIPAVPDAWRKLITPKEIESYIIAAGIGRTSISNTIVLVKDTMFIGMGVAQPSRVLACEVALLQAKQGKHDVKGAVAFSDSFFPFTDGPMVLAEAGVKAIFATSGSQNDDVVQDACSNAGVLLLTVPDAEARAFAQH